jgi:hypothetical protein
MIPAKTQRPIGRVRTETTTSIPNEAGARTIESKQLVPARINKGVGASMVPLGGGNNKGIGPHNKEPASSTAQNAGCFTIRRIC